MASGRDNPSRPTFHAIPSDGIHGMVSTCSNPPVPAKRDHATSSTTSGIAATTVATSWSRRSPSPALTFRASPTPTAARIGRRMAMVSMGRASRASMGWTGERTSSGDREHEQGEPQACRDQLQVLVAHPALEAAALPARAPHGSTGTLDRAVDPALVGRA